jgi:transposase
VQDNDFTKILAWPGYRVFHHEINEGAKRLRLWVRRVRRKRALICSGCGERVRDVVDASEREVRDLPWGEYRTTVVVEVFRVRCPDCGVRIERVPQLPSKAPFSKRFEDAVGLVCESASARQVGRQLGLAASTVRAIDLRYLTRWATQRRRPALKQLGVDEIWLGKRTKFLTVVTNLESGEPVWFGRDRTQATLDEFFRTELSRGQRSRIQTACVDCQRSPETA